MASASATSRSRSGSAVLICRPFTVETPSSSSGLTSRRTASVSRSWSGETMRGSRLRISPSSSTGFMSKKTAAPDLNSTAMPPPPVRKARGTLEKASSRSRPLTSMRSPSCSARTRISLLPMPPLPCRRAAQGPAGPSLSFRGQHSISTPISHADLALGGLKAPLSAPVDGPETQVSILSGSAEDQPEKDCP